ncbi:UDP-Glycosyltransferase/glycogen phosphorylase [Rhizoclosmatium globosum]|uniref:UDP-Glycosyltransferase/glycogen phosphorylase n=1 Tax=Rhizoclosmatium globosum TaxID=329046 RepID=A0A1Y2CIB9_9FUNG|nr:UDP-Glycosyltransferase/glycogen phosphorylase [Rhizoclosmatium globosum]|eukprot:ORY46779.1 UDP-Glycosyltransferase/glycogen phosphorylase [Rhizoclosmatium globosum]
MKIAFVVLGSRGDVQPFVAIAKELIRRGIPAVILAQRLFQPWIEREGIQFVDLPGHLTKDMSESLVAQALTTGNMKLLLNDFYNKERLGKTVHQVLTYLKNDKDVTLVVCGPAVTFLAPMMHYLSGVPFCGIHLVLDLFPSSQIPCQVFPWILPFGLSIRLCNLLLHSVVHAPVLKHVRNLDFSEFSNINMVKAVLPPQRILPHYFACSHNIMPRPSDWPADILVGGNVLYENRFGNNLLSPETEAFLDDGDAPVYIGFGSMAADLCTDFFAFINEVVEHSAQAIRFIVFARNME